jgi:hypothetical protein
MTGQVKEDILVRRSELGVSVHKGQLTFNPQLLRKNEFLSEPEWIKYFNVEGKSCKLQLPENTLFFMCCQVPVVYKISDEKKLSIEFLDGSVTDFHSDFLDEAISDKIFNRTGEIKQINVSITGIY